MNAVLSRVSQSSTPSWIIEETRISAARFLLPGFVLPERRPGTWERRIEAAERHRTAGGRSGAQTERVHWCDQSVQTSSQVTLRWSGAIAGSVTSSCSSWPSQRSIFAHFYSSKQTWMVISAACGFEKLQSLALNVNTLIDFSLSLLFVTVVMVK